MKRLLPIFVLLPVLVNCSGSFRAQKSSVLRSVKVFGGEEDGSASGTISQPADGTAGGTITQPSEPAPAPAPAPVPVAPPPPPPRPPHPMYFHCSFALASMFGGTPLRSCSYVTVSLGPQFLPWQGFSPLCSYTDSALPAAILATHGLPGSMLDRLETACAGIPDGTYYLNMTGPGGVTVFLSIAPQFIKSGGKINFGPGYLAGKELLIADNNPPDPSTPCDLIASPLLVTFSDGPHEPLRLTSQAQGVRFDILGENSDPRPHSPKQISWYHQQNYYFIALPDDHGEVNGIDQLFGNNTPGPDHMFAGHGYAALAKYDSNHDGWITKDDAVFAKLRLWKDDNGDGVAQAAELRSLREMKVTGIDLEPDSSFREIDRYGNETRMKSVVRTEDGKLHLMFDLWFKYLD
jgi:hypothetical protein